jgi:regulator of protease activity HflC (stomatin/prohibitin superfamily)
MIFKDKYKTTEEITHPRTGEKMMYTSYNKYTIIRDVVASIFIAGMVVKFQPFSTVPTGSRGVITQFGKIVGIEGEGLAVLPPWQKLNNFSVRAEGVILDHAEGSTSDTQPVHINLTVRYSVLPDKVAEVFEKYSHNGDLTSYVGTAIQESVKVVSARYTATDLIAKRAQVSTELKDTLQMKLTQYGAQVINIDMRNFAFSDSYMKAINEKVTQEQLRLGAENKLKTVESEQKQKVAVAEAESHAIKVRADGDAYANLTVAKAQAEALRVQNSALSQNKDVLELRRIEVEMEKAKSWNGVLPVNVYAGAPIPFLNVGK